MALARYHAAGDTDERESDDPSQKPAQEQENPRQTRRAQRAGRAHHPAGDLHAFVGFAEIRKLEEEFLAADAVAKKYAGAIGFQP